MVVMVSNKHIRVDRLELGPWRTNAYTIVCQETRDSVLVDAPADVKSIMESLQGTNPRYILLTHNHPDHTGALSPLRAKLGVPLAAHGADAAVLPSAPEILLSDADTVSFGKVKIQVIHTPGHTPGSLCFRIGKYLISGDTIFPGGPGKTNSPAGLSQVIESITSRIFVLPDDTEIYPGHGGSTVLKKEKAKFAVFSSRPHDPNLCGDVLWLSS